MIGYFYFKLLVLCNLDKRFCFVIEVEIIFFSKVNFNWLFF